MRQQTSDAGPVANAWLYRGNTSGATAAGNAQSDPGDAQAQAYPIPAGQDLTFFSSVPAYSGTILPELSLGEEYAVANHGANALLVYPPVGWQIGTLGVNVGYSLAAGKTAYFAVIVNNTFTACP